MNTKGNIGQTAAELEPIAACGLALRFRPRAPDDAPAVPIDQLAVCHMIDDAMRPGHFLVAPDLALSWIAARAETIAWEVFRGRLLEPGQTRLQQTFLSWHVLEGEEPLLSVKYDIYSRSIHVTRGLRRHVWEAFDAGGGAIDSREAIRWTQELVGTVSLDQFADLDEVRDELICLLWQAVVGTSRLPLTSVEAPLPAFVLGKFHYLYRPDADEQPLSSWENWLERGLRTPLAWRETVKLVEFALRHVAPADLPCLTAVFQAEWPEGASLPRLLRSLFNDVSLSPYTGFVENALAWVLAATRRYSGAERGQAAAGGITRSAPEYLRVAANGLELHETIDFLSHLLRQLGRHLTAYDLVTFHHRGANYPDALLLDAALKAYLRLIEARPDHFLANDAPAKMRRRALRQGCILRRHYEGHLVPDAPTSPGENARVMPSPYDRVPEEQLTQPLRRRRQLFADDPLPALLQQQVRLVLERSIEDLDDDAERIELGLGVFIDRPLGYAKEAVEPDLTPLLAHEAYSPSLAQRRRQELQRLWDELKMSPKPRGEVLRTPGLTASQGFGVPHPWAWVRGGLLHIQLADSPRPVPALADVRRVADDFVVLRTLPAGLAELMRLFDWRPLLERFHLRFLESGSVGWCAQVLNDQQQPVLALADATGQRRLEMRIDASQGYATRAGAEFPRAGLLIITVWEDTDHPTGLQRHDLKEMPRVRATGG